MQTHSVFHFHAWRRWLLPLLLTLMLGACSAVELGYAMAPRLAVKYADEYFYLSKRQEAQALALFEARKQEHQTEELPQYYAFAQRLEQRFEAGLDAGNLDASLDEGEQLLRLGLQKTLPAISTLMAELDEDQIEFFLGKLREKEDEYRQRIAAGETEAKREENEFEDLEEWTGKLRDEQKTLVRKYLAKMHDNREHWLHWRVERNRMLGELLKQQPDAMQIRQFLQNSWVERANISEELARRSASNRSVYIDMMLALETSLDEAQRSKVRERLTDSRELILALMPDDVQEQLLAELSAAR